MKRKLSLTFFLVLLSAGLFAQYTINGSITDMDGLPIPGANIIVKGTTNGTVTNLDGAYTLKDISRDNILVFSFIGMLSEEVVISDQTQINLALVPDILSLESVIVIGYGTVKKKDLTGAVASVTSEELTKLPTSNPIEALQGKVTGMDIVRSSGSAGSGVDVRIRGNRSINADNNPLYIIDGVQGGSYNDLNPNDIESISVLKDASSTAIYGSRGADGVIIITTKKGNSGKAVISYNGYYGVNGFTEYPEVRLRDDYIEFRKEAYRTTGTWDDAVHGEDDYGILFSIPEIEAIDNDQWVDWRDLILRNGTQQNHQISYAGGNEKTTSYFSLGYYKEEGVLVNDDYTRYTARVNVDHKASKWISLGMQTQFAYFDQNRRKDPFSTAISISPFGEAYDENGNINVIPFPSDGSLVSPLTDERENIAIDNTIRNHAMINGYLEIKPVKGVTFRSNLGTNLQFDRRGKYNDATSLAQKSSKETFSSIENSNSQRINWDNILSYSNVYGDHSISVTGLSSYYTSISEYNYGSGLNQANPNNSFHNLSAADAEGRVIQSNYTKSAIISFAGRINYSLKDKYLLSITERYDGASVLSESHKWDHFPSVSAAWKLHKESFLVNVNQINQLKLRGSYGVAGTSNIDPYDTQSGISPFAIGIGDGSGTAYKFNPLIGNSTVGWEKSKTINFGIDLGLFNNRINTTIDVYNTNTENLLLERELPKMTGVELIYQNIGATQNRGIEILLNTVNIDHKDFKWTSTLSYSKNNEKITKLIDGEDIINNEDNSLILGSPIHSFYTYKKLGIWQTGEEDQMDIYNITIDAGDIKLADLNNDSIFDGQDRTVIGSAVPKWILGFENTFSYKSFELSVYLFARWGQMINAEFLGRYNPSGTGNGPAYFNYWTPDNPTNDYPRPERGEALSNYIGYQTLNYVDGSYFKVKNVKLSYTLPNIIIQKTFISRLQVYVTASNLLTISKSHLIQNYDPERGGQESSPLSKQFIFGVNVDF